MEKTLRIGLLLLAAGCAWGAWRVEALPGLPRSEAVRRFEQAHPGPRGMSEADREGLEELFAITRRIDLLLLLAGLAVGCAAVALAPNLARRSGGPLAAVALVGSLAVGGWRLVSSAREQASAASEGGWTLGDDGLPAVAGNKTRALRAWREQVPEDHAVILVGGEKLLATAWALHPRPIYHVRARVPAVVSTKEILAIAREQDVGRGHAARWLVDLRPAARPSGGLPMKVDP